MIQFLAPLLGGLGGLLFPAAAGAAAGGAAATGIGALLAKAAIPALGAGLGTLAAGGGGKDAIRNALLMGVGVNVFPGLAGKIQGSDFGQSITGGLADIFGGGTQQAPTTSPLPQRRPEPGSAAMSTAGTGPERMGIATPGDRQGPMSTIPSLQEMASQEPLFAGARGFESRMGLPPDLDEYLSRMDLQDMSGQAFSNAQDMGMGSPRFMPPTGIAARNMDVQRAMDMARESSLNRDRGRTMDLLDIANRRQRGYGFAMGGEIEGPGTGTSDSIPAEIYQDGKPVQKAALSDGEFVMTADAVKGAGNGSRDRGVKRMYELMRRFESGEMV